MSLTTLLAIMKYTSRPKSTAIKDIDIDVIDIRGQQYGYRIDVGKGDINPPLILMKLSGKLGSGSRIVPFNLQGGSTLQ